MVSLLACEKRAGTIGNFMIVSALRTGIMKKSHFYEALVLVLFFSIVSGCGGGSSSSGGGPVADPPFSDPEDPTPDPGDNSSVETVADALTQMGVDISETPRQGDDMEPLPDDYSPFGSTRTFDVNEELVSIGFSLAGGAYEDRGMTLLELDRSGTSPIYSPDVLFAPEPASTPWAVSKGDITLNLRAATRGDFDGDGLDELAVVYRVDGQSDITLQIYEDSTQSFNTGQQIVLSSLPATSLSIGGGDLDGDGYFDLVIGLSLADSGEILYVNNDRGSLGLSDISKTLPQARSGSKLDLIVKTGNLDYDPSYEMVVLVNEIYGEPEQGTSRFFIIDDAKTGFTDISDALVQATGIVNSTAIVADVTLGDIDGDNLDEIVFAGLTNFDPNGICAYNYLLLAIDDLVRESVPLGATEHQPDIHGGCDQGQLRFVHVNTLDIDGDGLLEIQANELVFEDFSQYLPWTRLSAPLEFSSDILENVEISDDALFAGNGEIGFSGRFDRSNSAMVVGDLTADKRQDVIFYSQASDTLQVWGLSDPKEEPDPIKSGQWRQLHSLNTVSSEDTLNPILVATNVNHDSLSISFDEGDYKLIFTEPIIIAALAASPCFADLGQNSDACRTSLGTAESDSIEIENSYSITAGITVGFEQEFSAAGVKVGGIEVLASLKRSLSFANSTAYTLTKRIVYSTGPIEDTVIFTTIPLDQYTYTITSHPDSSLINTKVVVSMPRTPVEVQVERSFYNANVISGGPKIDETVFSHAAGDPLSYPGKSEKDAEKEQHPALEIGSVSIPLGGFFEVGPVSVGQGGGSTTLEINVAEESGNALAYGAEYELAIQGTAGSLVVGWSVGFSHEHSLSIAHGEESSYEGTVSNLPADTFASGSYEWGMFTYVHDHKKSGQQFEVINFWVN